MPKNLTAIVFAWILLCALPVYAQDDAAIEVTILAKQNLALHSKPDFYSNVLGIFESGEDLKAFGRDLEANWLQTAEGWVNARNVAADGDTMTLRQTAEAITLQASAKLDLRSGPDGSYRSTASLPKDQLTVAIGRNHDGTWLETPKGWTPASEVDFDGNTTALPVTFASITVTAAKNAAFLGAPTWEADVLEIFQRGSDAFGYERTEDSKWVKTPNGWVAVASGMEISGQLNSLPQTYLVVVKVLTKQNVYAGPTADRSIVTILNEGDESLALSRSEDGEWLQIIQGWVPAEAVQVRGDLMRLRLMPPGIKGTIRGLPSVGVGTRPRAGSTVRRVQRGEEVLVIGRDGSARWLQINDDWIAARYVKLDGDIMTLPVTDGNSATTSAIASTRSATATPTPDLDARAIRTLIARHTDDIRILDLTTTSSATTIEYDLKPWPFVPNESIANEVAFKIICAIRNGHQIPNTLNFIGHTHFKSEVGRKFTGPSVEMRISASNANRIVCRGNDPSDINWRRIASRYKSHPIPRGASIDYD